MGQKSSKISRFTPSQLAFERFKRDTWEYWQGIVKLWVVVVLKKPAEPHSVSERVQQLYGKNSEALMGEARKKLGIDKDKWNAVVCGPAGVGKSSLIKGFLNPDIEILPPVDVVECTKDAQTYKVSEMFWLFDIPGAGTLGEAADGYFARWCLYAFDLVIVVSATRLQKIECDVVKELIKCDVPFMLVRTKADVDVESLMYDENCSLEVAKQRLKDKTNGNLREDLGYGASHSLGCFVVSTHWMQSIQAKRPWDRNYDGMDENDLSETIKEQLEKRGTVNLSDINDQGVDGAEENGIVTRSA
ncbi:hypothetical protein M427DRAFT_427386 [Gonapodya prolifera JEL478]|uniref:IRG-type G domain-containing protein n=1 Tax=Gonapodya prolifera (strain JEL478) TaxID=1344416 RepID=A0A139ASK1_GONPJ|nr:hypothetical protein M427DRAFT_427386 [Gonapodya prolifera JEL478]|eukprot:KXS19679.1 hypothetical protein M427DRAFT_427386 [Gonapodya prolifera JEL478]